MRRSFLAAAVIAGLPLSLGAAERAAAQTVPQTVPWSSAPASANQADPGIARRGGMMKAMQAKFAAANTTHDGHLTLAQAQTAGLNLVVANFPAIDTGKRGYVTLNDIMAWRLDQLAARLQQRATALRAQD